MSKKPLIYTALTVPALLITALPLAFIVTAFVGTLTATVEATVGAGNITIAALAGVAVALVYVLWGTYATFRFCRQEYGSSS